MWLCGEELYQKYIQPGLGINKLEMILYKKGV
mgnify:CR=1 FL=1